MQIFTIIVIVVLGNEVTWCELLQKGPERNRSVTSISAASYKLFY
jgi:hypothetical protein